MSTSVLPILARTEGSVRTRLMVSSVGVPRDTPGLTVRQVRKGLVCKTGRYWVYTYTSFEILSLISFVFIALDKIEMWIIVFMSSACVVKQANLASCGLALHQLWPLAPVGNLGLLPTYWKVVKKADWIWIGFLFC